MKKRLSIILLFIAFAMLAGCGADSSVVEPTKASDDVSFEAVKGDIETKIFATVKGDIEIPMNPQKIVSDFYLGEFLALDVKPIICSTYSLSNPFLKEYIDGIAPLNTASAETSLEMIVASEPDLIVTLSEADYDTFSLIAPTVYIPYGTYSNEDLFIYIGDMLGKKDEAEAQILEFNSKVEKAKPIIQEIVGDRTVSFLEIWPKEIYVFGSHFGRGGSILFDMWELKSPPPIKENFIDKNEQYQVISLEKVPEYAGDFIMYGVLAGTDSSFVNESEVWKGLPAVKNDMVMKYEQVAFMHSDPITMQNQLDIYIDYFNTYKNK